MAEEKTLVEKQHFYAAEFEAEAAWLELMHREGWKFVSTDGWHYRFAESGMEDFVYQLDFKEDDAVDEDYLQMYADYGWEYVTCHRHWFYFRKRRSEGREEDFAIFSDSRSKMEMIERVIQGQVRRYIPLYLVMLAYQFLIFGTPFLDGTGALHMVLLIAAMLIMMVVLFGFGIYIGQLGQLQKLRKRLDEAQQ